jgi:hypothetical protein
MSYIALRPNYKKLGVVYMGILYNSVKLQKNMKREFVLERLLASGITKSQTGKSIQELSYDELKYELVLSAFREIDTNSDSGKWF